MLHLQIYLKCGKVIRDPSVDEEQFMRLVEWMDGPSTSISMLKNVWIRKDEVILMSLEESETYKNSDPSQ